MLSGLLLGSTIGKNWEGIREWEKSELGIFILLVPSVPRRQGTVLTLRVNDVRLTLVERVLLLTNAHTPLLWLDYITQLPAPPRGSTTSSCQWKWAPWSGDGSSLCSFSLPSSADQVQGVQRRTLRFYRMAVPVQRNSLVP